MRETLAGIETTGWFPYGRNMVSGCETGKSAAKLRILRCSIRCSMLECGSGTVGISGTGRGFSEPFSDVFSHNSHKRTIFHVGKHLAILSIVEKMEYKYAEEEP